MEAVKEGESTSEMAKLEKIRGRLKKEKETDEEEWKELGRYEGLEDAENMVYFDLKLLVEEAEQLRKLAGQHLINPISAWDSLPNDVRDVIEDNLKSEPPISKYYGINHDAFATGYLNGIEEFWDKVDGENL